MNIDYASPHGMAWRRVRSLSAVLGALIAIAIPRPASSQGAPPATSDIESIAKAWSEAFNSGDSARVRQFYAAFGDSAALGEDPMDARVKRYEAMRGQLLPIRFQRTLEEHPLSLEMLASIGLGVTMTITFLLSAQPPHRLTAVQLMPATDEVSEPTIPQPTPARAAPDSSPASGRPLGA
jgi:hypothetical protein